MDECLSVYIGRWCNQVYQAKVQHGRERQVLLLFWKRISLHLPASFIWRSGFDDQVRGPLRPMNGKKRLLIATVRTKDVRPVFRKHFTNQKWTIRFVWDHLNTRIVSCPFLQVVSPIIWYVLKDLELDSIKRGNVRKPVSGVEISVVRVGPSRLDFGNCA